jgi:hypothetical protein
LARDFVLPLAFTFAFRGADRTRDDVLDLRAIEPLRELRFLALLVARRFLATMTASRCNCSYPTLLGARNPGRRTRRRPKTYRVGFDPLKA